jgi:hypothetical protein
MDTGVMAVSPPAVEVVRAKQLGHPAEVCRLCSASVVLVLVLVLLKLSSCSLRCPRAFVFPKSRLQGQMLTLKNILPAGVICVCNRSC